ncbi:hypothetical protein ACFPA8_14260 [Streptomyces ovatisporus]|uniref:Uncharacterized protein n=1 Tax=Streptomyces ovatisporus TaxID=1128682 RepID=A0ABV9A9M2_9ACTN
MVYRRHRQRNVVVTLYSEPHYRGARQTFTYDQKAYALGRTRLPRVGSIRVERTDASFRRGPDTVGSFVAMAVKGDRETRAEALGWLPLALVRMADPSSWQREYDPAGSRQSWVHLWAERPTSPPPPCDDRTAPGKEPWRNFLESTPDVGAWSTRVRYIEAGVRNPHRDDEASPVPPGWAPGHALPLEIVE